jgi:hypothetical protein
MQRPAYIPATWDLPAPILHRLGSSVGNQRLIHEQGHLLLLLHHPPTAADHEKRQAAVFWLNPAEMGQSSASPDGLAGLRDHLAAYRAAIQQLDEAVDHARIPRDYFDALRRIHPLLRATRHLHEVLQAARQARPTDPQLINMRDEAAELERAIELATANAKAGMDFTVAEASSAHAKSAAETRAEARRLNQLAAFFLPLATLVTFFGMNPPEFIFDSPSSWMVLAAGLLLGSSVLAAVCFRGRTSG